MTEFLKESMQIDATQVALRLLCAMLIGVVIGMEREYTHRAAGLRTHILVALGACVVAITGEILFAQYNAAYGATPDPARLSAQVITGVGFLGTGTILKEGASVKGLTTAASVWSVACLGLAAGYGYFAVALLGMLFIFVTLSFFEKIQQKVVMGGVIEEHFILESSNISESLNQIATFAQEHKITVTNLTAEKQNGGYLINFDTSINGRRSKEHSRRFFDALMVSPESVSLRRSDKA